jgi:pimeloyl-ACP methyl ester carboxylesterase
MTTPTPLHPDLDASRRRVAVTGGSLSCIDHGEGEPIVFVHGVFLSNLLWAPAIELLPAGRRAIAFDLPGHGHSDAIGDGFHADVRSIAALLLEAMAALDLSGAHLVGNDSGGAIAQVMATSEPGRFASLTLTNCDTIGNIPPPGIAPLVELARAGGLVAILEQMQQQPELVRGDAGFGPSLEQPERLTDAHVAALVDPVMADPAKALQVQELLASFGEEDLAGIEAALADLPIPTLVAWGDDDPLFGPEWGVALTRHLGPRARHVVVEGGRLLYPFERPAELVRLLTEHIDAVPV